MANPAESPYLRPWRARTPLASMIRLQQPNHTRIQRLMSLPRNRGKTSGRSGCRAGPADEFREVGDGSVSGDIEPGTEIIPEGDAELGAGFGEAEEGIPAVASGIAAGAAADFAFGDVAADVVFGAVGVEWD